MAISDTFGGSTQGSRGRCTGFWDQQTTTIDCLAMVAVAVVVATVVVVEIHLLSKTNSTTMKTTPMVGR